MSSPTTVPPSHRLPCTAEEANQAACLNGGTCFAWDAGGGSRVVGCSCPPDWTGNRCEEMHIPYYQAQSPITGLAVGLALAGVLIIAVVALVVTLYIRRKRRRERPTLSSSNHASVSAVHVVDGKPSNGRLHSGSASQQTVSSILAHEPNSSNPLSMSYETQV